MHCLYRLYIFYSNHCLRIVFTMSTQCLHNISTLSTQCQCVFYRMYLFVRQIRFTRMYGNCVHRGPARPDVAIHALTWTSNPIKICITISHSKCPAPKHRETVLLSSYASTKAGNFWFVAIADPWRITYCKNLSKIVCDAASLSSWAARDSANQTASIHAAEFTWLPSNSNLVQIVVRAGAHVQDLAVMRLMCPCTSQPWLRCPCMILPTRRHGGCCFKQDANIRTKNTCNYVSTLCIAAKVLVRKVVATGSGALDSLLQNGFHAGQMAHLAINGQLLNETGAAQRHVTRTAN